MANRTINLYAEAFGYVDILQSRPIPVLDDVWYDIARNSVYDDKAMYIRFQKMPDSLARKKLISLSVTLQIKAKTAAASSQTTGTRAVRIDWLDDAGASFDPSTITWNNRPSYSDCSKDLYVDTGKTPVTSDYTYAEWTANTGNLIQRDFFAKNRTLVISSDYSPYQEYVEITNLLSDGTTRPYVTVTYDDSEEIVPHLSCNGGTNLDPLKPALTFFYYESATGKDAADITWDLAAATVYWKLQNDESYTSVPISTSDLEVTTSYGTTRYKYTGSDVILPIETFSRTLLWYIEVEDQYGTLYQAEPATITTAPVVVDISGSIANNTLPATFSWKLKTQSTEIPITHSTISWKTPTSSEISTNLQTTSYTFPAYTFPAGQTVTIKVKAYFDISGVENVNISSVSKSVLGYTLTLLNKPAGSNIDIRQEIQIPYTLTVEGYPNRSVDQINSTTFFWKKTSDLQYNSIVNQSAEKIVTVPSNTLPTGATVQWYVEVATADGTTWATAIAQFSTASSKIKLTNYPSGSDVCSGDGLIFKWILESPYGDYDQSSATLYWRYDTQQDYTTVPVSGNVKQIILPAETLDPGKTVSWHISATDVGGTSSQTSELSFTTAISQITPQNSPESGYADPREPILFSWYFAAGSGSVTGTASLFWKVSTASAYTEVQTTESSVEIPANTFPVASTIEWYLAGEDYSGHESETEVYSFSTAAGTAYATCVAPIGRVEDGTKPITFAWNVINADGTDPTRMLLQWKYSTETESAWRVILDTTDPVYSHTVAARYFSAGAIDWKVSAWNRDSVQGPESQASFICLMAPDAPQGLRATTAPRTTISWQSTSQEAYEIKIDGVVEALEYGPAVSSWKREEPLPDGVHHIEVRIQGPYGMWSTPAETSVDTVNVPTTAISLSGEFGVDALLSWEYEDTVTNPEPNVYRDGVRIAALKDVLEFADRLVLGEHEYYVTLWDENGYYSISNTVTGTMESRTPRICGADGGEWVELKLTTNSDGAESFDWSKNYALHNVRGASFPVIEIGSFETLVGTYSCAFSAENEAKKLESLRGRRVIIKSRRGNVITGVLLHLQKQVRAFFTEYSFSVQQMQWEDFIHDEDR